MLHITLPRTRAACRVLMFVALCLSACQRQAEQAAPEPTAPAPPIVEAPAIEKPPAKPAFVSNNPVTPKITALAKSAVKEANLADDASIEAKARALALAVARTARIRLDLKPAAWTVLFDDSRSMNIRDEAEGRSRWETALSEWNSIAQQLDAWKKQGRLHLSTARFSNQDVGLRDFDPEQPAAGTATHIGEALTETLRDGGPGGVLLISDGAETGSQRDPRSVGRVLRDAGRPVFALALGSDVASSDVSVHALQVPPVCKAGDEVTVEAHVRIDALPVKELTFELLGSALDEEPKVLNTAKVTRDVDEGERMVVTFPAVRAPARPGEWMLTVRVPKQEGEWTDANNQSSKLVQVRRGGIQTLLVAGPKSVESAVIQMSLKKEAAISLRVVQAASETPTDMGDWKNAVEKEFPPESPETRTAVPRFDVCILCDVSGTDLPIDVLERLVKVVESGTGLLVCGGERAFTNANWRRTPVASLLPIDLFREGRLKDDTRLVVTKVGFASSVLRLAGKADASQEAWSKLVVKSPAWMIGDTKPLGIVWATDESEKEPLLVVQEVGRGRTGVLSFATSGWMATDAPEEAHRAHTKVWSQLIAYLAKQDADFGEPALSLELILEQSHSHHSIRAVLKVPPELGTELSVDGTLLVPRGDPEPVRFVRRSDGDYESRIDVHGPAGVYGVRVRATGPDGKMYEASARILCPELPDLELLSPRPNHLLLNEIAQVSGGKVYRPGELKKFVKQVEAQLASPPLKSAADLEALVCEHHQGSIEDIAAGLASLLQSQSISSRIIRDEKGEGGTLVEIPLAEGRVLRIDPATGKEPVVVAGRTIHLVFDVGPLMSARSGDLDWLDVARRQAHKVVDAAPRRSRFAAHTNGVGDAFIPTDARQLHQWLDRLTIEPGTRPMARAVESALQFERREPSGQAVGIVVFSDRQSHSWTQGAADLTSMLERARKEIPQGVELFLVNVGEPTLDNRSFERVTLNDLEGPAGGLQIEAVVSQNIPAGQEVVVHQDGSDEADRVVTLEADAREAKFSLSVRPGMQQGVVRFSGADAFSLDDAYYWTHNVGVVSEVLVIADESSRDAPWLTALDVLRDGPSPIRHRICTLRDIPPLEELTKFSLVYLLGVQQPADDDWKTLQTFVRAGGRLTVLPPAQADLKAYSSPTALELLPGRLKSVKGPLDDVSFDYSSQNPHPLESVLKKLMIPVQITKHWELADIAKEARVVLNLTNKSPALLERPAAGGGSTWLITTDLARGFGAGGNAESWNNIMLTPLAVVFAAELTHHAGRSNEVPTQFTAGHPISFPTTRKDSYLLLANQRRDERTLEVTPRDGVLRLEGNLLPGNYRLVAPSDPQDPGFAFSVNLSAEATRRGGAEVEKAVQTVFGEKRILDGRAEIIEHILPRNGEVGSGPKK